MNLSYLREYAQSLQKKAGAEVESTVEQPSRDAQNQTRYVEPLGNKPELLFPIIEEPVIEASCFSWFFNCVQSRPDEVDQEEDFKPQDTSK